jgi:Protein of unknown function (DUF3500)
MPNRLADFKLRPRPSTSARAFPSGSEFLLKYRDDGEARIAQPFKGITTDGVIAPGLFKIDKTGVSTAPIKAAADVFLASLGPHERDHTLFSVDTDAWRRWSNIHPFVMRHGVCFDTMTPTQREHALALLRASLSAQGFETARGVMKLNEAIREITGRDDEYGEWLYWLSIMGRPSDDAPWGWQIDGHHLIVNCFVLGDQVVMTPMFMGSEPVAVDEGRHAGTRVFEVEERDGLALVQALTDQQRAKTILGDTLPTEVFTAAFRDNVELGYQGIRYGELSSAQQRLMLGLVDTYVGRIRPGHAAVKMDEVSRHLADTHFAWIGGVADDSVFYYRIHSPVVLIEFDHQRGIALDNDQPARTHIHTVIRTPNGNDYGRDLLRQHHAEFDHRRPGHSHA